MKRKQKKMSAKTKNYMDYAITAVEKAILVKTVDKENT